MSLYPVEPDVSVESLELLLVSMPFSAGRRLPAGEESIDKFNASSRAFTRMETLMVKATSNDGRIGWGEAFGHLCNATTWTALEDLVAPFYLGRTVDPVALHAEAERAFHAFGRTGPVRYAVSALDTALWDLAAQTSGMPLRQLLDPAARDSIRAYASLVHYGEDSVEVAHQVGRARSAGYSAFKLHESTYAAIAAARGEVGAEAPLMVDVNCRWTEAEATRALEEIRALNLTWMEEPLWPPDDHRAMARLNTLGTPLAAGENSSGVVPLVEAMNSGAFSFAQPSVGKIGGVTSMLDVFAAGRRMGVEVVPHCFYYGPALAASAQLVATLPQSVELEVPFLDWTELLHPLHGAGPELKLSAEPGLGFSPDPAVLDRHLIRHKTIKGQ